MRKAFIWMICLIGSLAAALFVIHEVRMLGSDLEVYSEFVWMQAKRSQQITTALRTYADSHDGGLPESLDDLVAAQLLEPTELTIDLMDGKAPVRWIYLGRERRDGYSWVLISPPISNDAGAFRRMFRSAVGAADMPPRKEQWICAWLDGSAEVQSEGGLKAMMRMERMLHSEADQSR